MGGACGTNREHVKGVPLFGRGFPGQRGVFQRFQPVGALSWCGEIHLSVLSTAYARQRMEDEAYHSGNLPSREFSEEVSSHNPAGKPGRKMEVGGALAESRSL